MDLLARGRRGGRLDGAGGRGRDAPVRARLHVVLQWQWLGARQRVDRHPGGRVAQVCGQERGNF